MRNEAPSRTVVLAALAPSPDCTRVVELALSMARLLAQPEVHFVHVADTGWNSEPVPRSYLLAQAREFLESTVAYPADVEVHSRVVEGSPAKEILVVADELEAMFIVVGAHRRGLSQLVLGSVADKVVREARCPVVVARATTYPRGPAIEPACADCVEVRRSSSGDVQWCARHASRHVHGHTYSETPEPFAVGSSLLRP